MIIKGVIFRGDGKTKTKYTIRDSYVKHLISCKFKKSMKNVYQFIFVVIFIYF